MLSQVMTIKATLDVKLNDAFSKRESSSLSFFYKKSNFPQKWAFELKLDYKDIKQLVIYDD